MYGIVEWLFGLFLGNIGYFWLDILLGNMLYLYIYVVNNFLEFMLVKCWGYGVLIFYNIFFYSWVSLYKELVSL